MCKFIKIVNFGMISNGSYLKQNECPFGYWGSPRTGCKSEYKLY